MHYRDESTPAMLRSCARFNSERLSFVSPMLEQEGFEGGEP